MERVSERPKEKKKKASSDEASASDVSKDTTTENVLSELKDLVSDLSQDTIEKSAANSDLSQQLVSTAPVSEIPKKEESLASAALPTSQATTATSRTSKIDPRVRTILPPWMEKAWRWVTPDDPELREEWLREWGDLVLSYAEALELHFLKPREIMVNVPFKNPLVKRQLSLEQIHSVGDDLERRQLAKWWDSRKNRLRIYWLQLDEISDLIHDWALDGGRDVCTLYDLRNAGEEWSSVPPKELRLLMEILVKTKRANWADKAKEAIEFIY
ncbi:MAG: hypothetical protein ACFFB3_00870 [Candidatus Hodarchaeota archaeon]